MAHGSSVSLRQRSPSGSGDLRLALATLLGAGAIAVGAVLPWLQSNPARELTRFVYLPGMASGLEVDVTLGLLLVVAVSVALSVRHGRTRPTGAVVVLAGESAIALPSYVLLDSYTAFGGDFIPHVGSLLTILGGITLLGTGIAVFVNTHYE